MTDLDTQAKALYERNTNGSAPSWEMLGEVTKGVWREEVIGIRGTNMNAHWMKHLETKDDIE